MSLFGSFNLFRMNLFMTMHTITDVLSLCFNGLLIFLIIFHTSPTFRSYSIIMLCVALGDMVLGVSACFVMDRLIPLGWSLVYGSHGSCRHFGPTVCLIGHGISIHAAAYVYTLLPVMFWYRYRIICQAAPAPKTVALICLAIYLPAFVTLIFFCFSGSPSNELYDVMVKHNFTIFPTDNSLVSYNGFVSIAQKGALPLLFWICVPTFPSYFISMHYRRRILRALNCSDSMSEKRREMQTKMITALTIQAYIPIVFLSQATVYFWKQFELPGHEDCPYFEEWVFVALAMVSACSPVISMYYVMPYRMKIVNFFKRTTVRDNKLHSETRSSAHDLTAQMA